MKKIEEAKARLITLKNEASILLDQNKVEEAKAKMKEIEEVKDTIQMLEVLEEMEKENLQQKHMENKNNEPKTEAVNAIRAMIKKISGQRLTEAENALLIPSPTTGDGTKGEGFILPKDVQTKIREKMKDYASMRSVVGYYPTSALSGSFPIEGFDTITELVDFADGTDGVDDTDVSFKNVTFALKEKGAFIKLSNTLLSLTDNALIEYISRIFALKAVVTENKMIIEALKKGKSKKTLASWRDLKSSVNKDLATVAWGTTVIITNQDGFDYLDKQEDKNGRPILQPNPANPTQMTLGGYPIKVFSNATLPSDTTKVPFFYGSTVNGVAMVDLEGKIGFATSKEAGFMSNTTIARLIVFIDTIQIDSSDKCYCYGEIDTAPVVG